MDSLSLPVRFVFPELFLLAVPLFLAWRRWGRVRGVTGWLRLGILALLLLALTGPELDVGGKGLDVVVVADRSRSMPAEATPRIAELIQNLDRNRGPGDRVGLVTFGSQAQVERILSREAVFGGYQKEVLPDGSDLNDAVAAALNLVDRDRPARILVLSDGEANGPDPRSAARRSREEGVPIDYRTFERSRIGDVAVQSLSLPEEVAPREPFQFSVRVYADRAASGTIVVKRDEQVIARDERDLTPGVNQVLFRDLIEQGGLSQYTVEVDVPDDPLRENNRGEGVVRVDAGPKVLVLNTDGQRGNLVRALEAGRIPVDVAVAKNHPLTQDALDPYRAVVVENVPADHLGRQKMERLAQFVEDLGGGLLLTGGERSFGTGGYFKSPLDEVLPVSMEMREEHRKNRVAIAIALDRSGSMTAPVRGGKVKMDLANLGTAECIKLLSPQDMVAVIAVDSTPHVVQSMTTVDDPQSIISDVLKIESLGGGIFVYEALVAAGQELMKADGYSTRHIILFSDAQDSEEPGDYKRLLAEYEAAGITVSVIGLGEETDVDAELLKDIAKLGRGNIMFTSDAEELPRLFTQDTMSIARSTFVTKDENYPNGIPGQLLADARLIGELGAGRFPNADGYNLSYLKPEATAGVVSQDEYVAPWSAFWYRGLGRAAAITLEVDGKHSGAFGRWENYEDFLITHVRWLMGGDRPDDIFVDLARDGQDAVVTVELDPERRQDRSQPPTLMLVPPGSEREKTISPLFTWTGPHTLEARFRMDRTGTWRTLVKSGERQFVRGPAVSLPYSPEYAPRVGLPEGKALLAEMADLTGGQQRTDVLEVFKDPPRAARTLPLLPYLLIAGIVLLLVEIAGRRLSLWERVADALVPVTPEGVPMPLPQRRWLPQWKLRRPQRAPRPAVASPKPAAAPAPSPQPQPAAAVNVFEQAKQRAKRRVQ